MSGPAPTLLRSMTSAVLLDGRGDLELGWEARGAVADWGGVYGQLVRLTGPWRLSLELGDHEYDLPSTLTEATQTGERWSSVHELGPLHVEQSVSPTGAPPGAVRTLRLRCRNRTATPVVVRSTISPYLLPVLVEGVRPTDFQLETRSEEIRIRQRTFALALDSSPLPSRLLVDRASWRGGRRRGPMAELVVEYDLGVLPDASTELRLGLRGGLERDLASAGSPSTIADPTAVAAELALEEDRWLATTPELHFPQAPELEDGYRQARAGLRRLYSAPGDGMTGLVAGYPWYGAIWCRDLAWMLPAVLWLGDLAWVRASIDSVFRLQATREVPLLAAEPGEIPMQISPGPVLLFGTSDTTLHYPALVRRYLRHSGEPALPDGWSEAVGRALDWGERRADAATGLLRHGGEVEAIERAAGPLARVRYGIDSPDTTVWDSADRRDMAIDIQVLWSRALRAGAEPELGRPPKERAKYSELAGRLAGSVPGRYAWPEEGYLVDSLRAGEPVRRVRPNALLAAGLLSPEAAKALVRRASAPDLSTAWGLRTLSSNDPDYSPTAYHDGQVWTIATAWAAEAAFTAGEPELGLAHLRTIAARYARESGGANECYRGDREEPFNSCFLLGFSVGPFLTVLFEQLWGLAVDARLPRLTVRPAFPAGWNGVTLERLRVGPGMADLVYANGQLTVRWSGTHSLEVVTPWGVASVAPRSSARFGPGPSPGR